MWVWSHWCLSRRARDERPTVFWNRVQDTCSLEYVGTIHTFPSQGTWKLSLETLSLSRGTPGVSKTSRRCVRFGSQAHTKGHPLITHTPNPKRPPITVRLATRAPSPHAHSFRKVRALRRKRARRGEKKTAQLTQHKWRSSLSLSQSERSNPPPIPHPERSKVTLDFLSAREPIAEGASELISKCRATTVHNDGDSVLCAPKNPRTHHFALGDILYMRSHQSPLHETRGVSIG